MEEHVPFDEWVGENVMVNLTTGDVPAGKLEEINDRGIVLRRTQAIWWTPDGEEPDEEGYMRTKQVVRTVSEFYPWSVVYNVRVLEPDEAVERGF